MVRTKRTLHPLQQEKEQQQPKEKKRKKTNEGIKHTVANSSSASKPRDPSEKKCRHSCGCQKTSRLPVIYHKIIRGTLTTHEYNNKSHPYCNEGCNWQRNPPPRRNRPIQSNNNSSNSSNSSGGAGVVVVYDHDQQDHRRTRRQKQLKSITTPIEDAIPSTQFSELLINIIDQQRKTINLLRTNTSNSST